MTTPQKHRDAIIAWANGEAIEWRLNKAEPWEVLVGEHPIFSVNFEYRIKPKHVKKEGWVNIYKNTVLIAVEDIPFSAYPSVQVFDSKETADHFAENGTIKPRLACVRVEWEEEQ